MDRRTKTDSDFDRKVAQLDRLLNDPETQMEPDLIWSLLAEVSRADRRISLLAA
jgi:predicted ATPase